MKRLVILLFTFFFATEKSDAQDLWVKVSDNPPKLKYNKFFLVKDVNTNKPIPNFPFSFYSNTGEVLGNTKTDSLGYAPIKLSDEQYPDTINFFMQEKNYKAVTNNLPFKSKRESIDTIPVFVKPKSRTED